MKLFEYKITKAHTHINEDRLNLLGNRGWELVNIGEMDHRYSVSGNSFVALIFKREIIPVKQEQVKEDKK